MAPPQIALACASSRSRHIQSVHKDKPPGIFAINERSTRYAAGFCFVAGFILSIIVRIIIVLTTEHFSQTAPWSGV